jgi:hypothetical protein
MISTYHNHDTRTVTIRGKEIFKPILVLDYNQDELTWKITSALLLDWEKADEQMVYEAILQASECLNSECHDNIQE